MAGFKKSGIDLDSLLEPIGSFTKRTNVNYTINGVDISNIYCNAADGAAYGTTGFLANNVDIGTLFAAVGTTTVAGQLWIWGGNWSGQLGNNSSTNGSPNAGVSSPIQTVAGGSNWKTISASSRDTSNTFRSAGIKTDGTLWLWGEGVTSPAQGKGTGTNWKEVSPGICSAAVKTDGTLWLWGNNQYGNLGTNNTTNNTSPVQTVAGGTNWKQATVSDYATAAVKTDGTLWLWGKNDFGQLGDNTRTNRSSPVQTISAGTNWKQVSKGFRHAAAIKTDGTLWLWGDNGNGQLGDNTTTNRSSPVQTVAGGSNWAQVTVGNGHTAAIKTDGTLWLWGNNQYGNLGTNNTTNRSSPVQTISAGTNWKQVSSIASNNTGAIKTDGTLWMWGANNEYVGAGAIGDNTTTNRSSPVQTIAAGSTWKVISVGNTFAMAIK